MTNLTIPISAESLDRARRQIAEALAAGAEMLELRTDYLESLDGGSVAALIGHLRDASPTRVPVIVTCRDSREGGARPHPDELRMLMLLKAAEAGADFIDLEYANFVRPEFGHIIRASLATRPRTRLILSAHELTGRFPDLRGLYREIAQACPGVVPKLVYTVNHINDCFEAFDLLHETTGDRIVLCMGESGLISRILARKLGGFVTFASIDRQAATAPGQLTAGTLKGLYRYDAIDAATELFGVIADPVAHSLSPAIHNACLADGGINGLYLPLLVQGGASEFNTFLDHILARPWLDFRGFSVTIPHKHSALEYVRRQGGFIEPLADKIGVANTLVCAPSSWRGRPALASRGHRGPALPGHDASVGSKERGQDAPATAAEPHRLAAYNTDYAGALDAITQGMGIDRGDLRGVPVAVVGAGGVSRAIVAGLTDAGARITVYNRTVARAEKLAADFGCQAAGLDELARLDATLLINCTSIGMYPHVDASPIPATCLKPDMTVFDTVYNPAETLLLKQAKAKGVKTIDGITMFVNQAAAQFHRFTGRLADPERMRKVVLNQTRTTCGGA